MPAYQTMTVGGIFGQVVEAPNDERAVEEAGIAGLEVLDVIEHNGEPTLVVAG